MTHKDLIKKGVEIRLIPNLNGKYYASSNGLILNRQQVLAQRTTVNGYMRVELYNNGVKKRYLVHRLVAKTFLPLIEGKELVNHKDCVKTNNDIGNLEWVTCRENLQHAIKFYGHGNRPKRAVNQYTREGQFIKRWDSQKDIAKSFGTRTGSITSHLYRDRKSWKGYKWKFVDQEDVVERLKELEEVK